MVVEEGEGVFRFGAGVGTLAQETKLRVLTLSPVLGSSSRPGRLSAAAAAAAIN